MTKVATPQPITRAMARACPRIPQTSRSNFRSSALIMGPSGPTTRPVRAGSVSEGLFLPSLTLRWWVSSVANATSPCGAWSADERRTFGAEQQVLTLLEVVGSLATLLTHHLRFRLGLYHARSFAARWCGF